MGGGELVEEMDDRAASYDDMEARESKSLTNCCSNEGEFEERAEEEKSSNEFCREEFDCIRVIPKRLGRCRNREDPGSLSTVAKEMTDSLPTLCTSDEDIE